MKLKVDWEEVNPDMNYATIDHEGRIILWCEEPIYDEVKGWWRSKEMGSGCIAIARPEFDVRKGMVYIEGAENSLQKRPLKKLNRR